MDENNLVLKITVDTNDRYKIVSPSGIVESSILMNVQQIIGTMLRTAPVALPDSKVQQQVPTPGNVQA